ncbi:MAG: Hsp70 family protein [Armatimonadetes bacterium]|nr:Hsp70 family protein [Armatimonadota bacterium]
MDLWVGLDLGHTFTRLAWRQPNGTLELVSDIEGCRHIPTMAAADAGGLVYGQSAARLIATKPDAVVRDLLHRFARDSYVSLPSGAVHASELLRGLLQHCRVSLKSALGHPVKSAAVAVPPRWTDAVIERLVACGAEAGLDLTPIDSPLAAVLACGFARPTPEPRRVLVLDMGGEQFNVSLVNAESGRLERIALSQRDHIAGHAFTNHIVDFVCSRASQDSGFDLRHEKWLMAELPQRAEAAKLELGRVAWSMIDFRDLERPGGGDPVDVEVGVLTEDFESMIESSVAEAMEAAREVIRAGHPTDLLLVGGSCQIPFVQRHFETSFPRVPLLQASPTEQTAFGAAIYASRPPVQVGALAAPPPPPPVATASVAPPAVRLELPWREVQVTETRLELARHAWLRVETPLPTLSTAQGGPLHLRLVDPLPETVELRLWVEQPGAAPRELWQSVPVPPGAKAGDALTLALNVDAAGVLGLTVTAADGPPRLADGWTAPPAPREAPVPTAAAVTVTGGGASRWAGRELVERGNSVEVHRATDTLTGRHVLVKTFADASDVGRSLFLGSLNVLGIDHPNLARLLDFGSAEGGWYVVNEWDEWVTLRDAAGTPEQRHPHPANWCLEVVRQACAGVAALHERRVCHRNLKPSNILVRSIGPDVRVTDFEHAASVRGRECLTDVVGTLPYMAREVIERQTDLRSDVYALGVILFELLTGYQPFAATGQRELMEAIRHHPTPVPSHFNPNLPAFVDRLLLRLLDKDPDQRPRDAGELLAELSELKFDDDPVSAETMRGDGGEELHWQKPEDMWDEPV